MSADILSFVITVLISFINIYNVLLIVRILLSWFPTAGWAYQIMSFLSPITDPYLNIFRSIIPPLGGIDFSPILAFILLNVIQSLLSSVLVATPSFTSL
jgi:YggT family protein